MKEDQTRKISELTLYPTDACNFSCDYCFATRGGRRMSRRVADRVLDFFIPDRVEERFTLWFFGGEPLLEWGLIRHIVERGREKAAENGVAISFGVTTNGYLLDQDKVGFMVREGFGLIVSYDGRLSHGEMRGPGDRNERERAKERVEENIQMALATPLGDRAICALQVPSGQVSRLYDNVMSAFNLGFKTVAMNKVVDGYRPYTGEDLKELEKQFKKLGDWVLEERLRRGGRALQFFDKHLAWLCHGARDPCNPYTCGAAKGSLSVGPSGDIYPCQRLHRRDFRLGSVFHGINQEKREEFLGLRFNQCASCEVEPCAPCFASNLERTGDPLRIPGENCAYERRLFRASRRVYRLMGFFQKNEGPWGG